MTHRATAGFADHVEPENTRYRLNSAAQALPIPVDDAGPLCSARQQLEYLATHDSLTGFYNRDYLTERLRALLEPTGGHVADSTHIAVMFVDLDGFRKINDIAGHEVGDALLGSVARRLSSCVREEDMLARIDGDEFAIVIRRSEGTATFSAFARHVLETIAVPFEVSGSEYCLGASIGISLFPEDGRDAATLMRNAGSAMYLAKQRGRNNLQFFMAEQSRHLQRRFTLERSLRRALAAGELTLVYQPIVDSTSGRTVCAEALMRWRNVELGDVSPAEFIPVAEHTGMIDTIGHWMLERACMQAVEWRRTFAPELTIAVNMSPRQFNSDLVERVKDCLVRTGLEPGALELEITEGLPLRDSDGALPILAALTDLGVRITADDFGTGYSSLSYLNRFPLHSVKVDRSFVAGLPDRRHSVAITHAVVAMAHALGVNVTAEGVETPAQASFLRSIGCDRLQGYLFSRPVGSGAFIRSLSVGYEDRRVSGRS